MAAATKSINFPLLDYGHDCFPSLLSPHHPYSAKEAFQWLDTFEFMPEKYRALVETGQVTRLIARMYPFATRTGLTLSTQFIIWAIYVDDFFFERSFSRSPDGASAFALWLHEVMDDPAGTRHQACSRATLDRLSPEDAKRAERALRAFAELMQRMADYASPSQYMRFVQAVDLFLLGMMWETGLRSTQTIPHETDYQTGRRYTIGIPLSITLSTIADAYELPDNEYHQPAMRRLKTLAGNIWWLCNDIASYPNEKYPNADAVATYPTILMHRRGMTEQQAIDESARLHNEAVAEYVALSAEIRATASHELDRFILAMGAVMRGLYDYVVHEGGRYPVRDFFHDPNRIFPDLRGEEHEHESGN